MAERHRLSEKLRRLEAVFAGTNFEGERVAAGVAMQKLHEKLRQIEEADPPVEFKFSMGDSWSRKLFVALLRRYRMTPYRYPRQRHTTVMVRASKSFVDKTLWPEFLELSDVLDVYLEEVTNRLIADCICSDTSEAATVKELDRLT